MIVTLKSDALTLQIDTLGAQMISLKNADGVELIWQANPAIWGRHAPLLFPIIGRLRDNRYTVGGVEYKMKQHGFARDTEFTLIHQDETSATFTMTENKESLKKYPFSFLLEVTYRLEGNKLTKIHTVTNHSNTVMYYELGGHDGFRTTLMEGERMEDYYISFPNQKQIVPFGMDENNYLTKSNAPYALQGNRLPLPPRVFGLDTIVLENLPVHEVTLANRANNISITMEFEEYPYLGIWTKPSPENTDYICIEPWTTLPECAFTDSALEHKPGIRALAPNGSERTGYSITVR